MVVNNNILKELDAMYEYHKEKYGNREMSDKELREILRL